MKKLAVLLFTSCFCSMTASAQDMDKIRQQMDSLYQINILKTRINGVYIPASFEEAFAELDALSEARDRQKFKNADEETVARKLHFGLGRWMRVNWNFDEGSRISHLMRNLGIHHPDDMVNFMLRSYHRHLNKVDQQMEERAKVYIAYRKAKIREQWEKGEVLYSGSKEDMPYKEKN